MMQEPSPEFLNSVKHLAELARDEDLGPHRVDLTSALLPDKGQARYEILIKEPGVFCGHAVAETIANVFDPAVTIQWDETTQDGMIVSDSPHAVGTLTGPRDSILTLERTLLNVLQRLSSIATLTRRYVDAVAHTNAKIYDTRKTLPGYRLLEKYAVRCGGGLNHRAGLHDAVLVKDNHLAGVPPERLAGHVFQLLNRVGDLPVTPAFVQVEVDNLLQFEQLLDVLGIDIILLDNFPLDEMAVAIRLRAERNLEGRIALEASGGITLDTIVPIAETGIDRISVGAITHSAPALDISLHD